LALVQNLPGTPIFVTGLLAGVMLGVAMEQQTAQKLPEAAWTLRQQNDDALFRR
jgi:hypothetical protein